MDTDVTKLDAHFKSHYEIKTFSAGHNKKVFLASAIDPQPELPSPFVVKRFGSQPPHSEFLIHTELSKSSEDILKLWHSWADDQSFTMCVEYLPNGTLQAYLDSNKGLNRRFDHCLIYCYQLANTLFQLHSRSICHRDIKPLNIFISENFNYFKLGDFGESKFVDDPSGVHTILGTPYYMSPEQLKSVLDKKRLKVNPYRDDLWALGKTFWEIYTGRLNPEIFNLPVRQIWGIIDGGLGKSPSEAKFGELVKEMLCDLDGFDTSAGQVRTQVYEIYTECKRLEGLACSPSPGNHNSWRDCEDNRNPNEVSNASFDVVNDSSCFHCRLSIEGNKIVLPCKHAWHHKCFNDLILKPFVQSNRKNLIPRCPCNESISLAYFENLRILDRKKKIFFKLQEYSRCQSFCPHCSYQNLYFLLNNKLRPYNIKCTDCLHKFCSFCNVSGGHLLFCRLFKEFSENGSVDLARYINRK